tara:strand:- start:16772 stop:17623 length:852 start_codon:yes stop_codon:yes gene_type:complete
MALDRVHSSETQLFYTGVRVPAVQSINFSTEKNSTDLRPLGNLSYGDRILNSNQTTNFSYSIIATTGASAFDPFYTFQEGEEGFLSTESYGFEVKDFAGKNTITGAYLTSYGLEGSVGSFVIGSSTYNADTVSFTSSDAIDFSDTSSDSFKVFIPRNIEITSSNLSTEGASTETLNIQNFSINVAINRGAINKLGSRTPDFRYPQLPIDGAFNIGFLKNSVTGIDLSSLVVDTGTMSVDLKSDDGLTRMSYTMKQCSLKSVSESINLDGNNVINFSYTFCVKK